MNNIKHGVYRGLAVKVNNEKEFNILKLFLGEDILYLDWVPQMAKVPTGVIIHHELKSRFSIGSVGSVKYQESSGVRVVDFNGYFKS